MKQLLIILIQLLAYTAIAKYDIVGYKETTRNESLTKNSIDRKYERVIKDSVHFTNVPTHCTFLYSDTGKRIVYQDSLIIITIENYSFMEKPFTRVPEDEHHQLYITDSVHFTNVSQFYHIDGMFSDSSDTLNDVPNPVLDQNEKQELKKSFNLKETTRNDNLYHYNLVNNTSKLEVEYQPLTNDSIDQKYVCIIRGSAHFPNISSNCIFDYYDSEDGKLYQCNLTFDNSHPDSALEKPFTRVPEGENYQCIIRDSVHFTNVSHFFSIDTMPLFYNDTVKHVLRQVSDQEEKQELKHPLPIIKKNDVQLKYYPNPCNGILQVSTNANIPELNIININGEEILKVTLNQTLTDTSIDMTQYPAGVYFLRYCVDGICKSQKFVLIH